MIIIYRHSNHIPTRTSDHMCTHMIIYGRYMISELKHIWYHIPTCRSQKSKIIYDQRSIYEDHIWDHIPTSPKPEKLLIIYGIIYDHYSNHIPTSFKSYVDMIIYEFIYETTYDYLYVILYDQ